MTLLTVPDFSGAFSGSGWYSAKWRERRFLPQCLHNADMANLTKRERDTFSALAEPLTDAALIDGRYRDL